MSGAPTIVALWLDGQACSVETREAWALGPLDADRIYRAAREAGLGACLVSTCFRVELAVSGDRTAADLLDWGRRQLAAARPEAPAVTFREAEGRAAARHVFRVASGLESAVLGEAQILGQVRRARADAEAGGVLRPELRHLFSGAVRTGQWARRVTPLGRGTASTASAAVQWAEAMGGLEGRRVMVMGAGEIGRLLLGRLADVGAASLTLVSAHAPEHHGFHVVRPDAVAEALPATDVLFTATDRTALTAADARAAWSEGAPRVVVDLGLPRNVETAVGALPGVTLADVDALGAVVDAGLEARQDAVPEVEAAIEAALDRLGDELDTLGREALVADFRRRSEAIRQETLAYVCGKCEDRTCGAAVEAEAPGHGPCSDLEMLTQTLTTRLLHDVTAALRASPSDDDTLRQLLALDD